MTQRKPIISARRTDMLEDLLQKLWTLRPIYKNKHAFTISAGVAALIREIERTDLILGGGGEPSLLPSANDTETRVAAEAEVTTDGQTVKLSTDVEWG